MDIINISVRAATALVKKMFFCFYVKDKPDDISIGIELIIVLVLSVSLCLKISVVLSVAFSPLASVSQTSHSYRIAGIPSPLS